MSHDRPACRMIPPADTPQFNVCANASWPNRVHFAIGTGGDGYNITPERAEELAQQLIDAARDTRGAE